MTLLEVSKYFQKEFSNKLFVLNLAKDTKIKKVHRYSLKRLTFHAPGGFYITITCHVRKLRFSNCLTDYILFHHN